MFVPATDGERLYADVDRRIDAFDLDTGTRLWSYDRPDGGPSSLVPRDGRLYFVGNIAVALDAATGDELWRYTPESYAGFSETDADADAFYFGTDRRRVYALSATDGELLWTRELGQDWEYEEDIVRGVTVRGDTLYVTVEHSTGINKHIGIGEIFALDRHTGETLWNYSNGDGNSLSIFQSAVAATDQLVIGTANWENTFVAVDRFSGEEVWRVSGDPCCFGPQEPPIVSGGVAYGASHDRHAKAIEISTGTLIWETPVPSGVNNFAICGSRLLLNYSRLGVIDPANGVFLGEYSGPGHEIMVADFAVADDRAYVFSNKALYRFECPG